MSTNIQTCTTITRPTANLVAGDMRFETDTKNVIVWDGTSWRGYQSDGASGWSGTNDYSMNFDGTDDRLNVASPVTTSAQQGSISAWIKTTSTSNTIVFTQTDVSDTSNNTWLFVGILSDGKPRIGYRNGTPYLKLQGSTAVNDGNWHHLAFTSDGASWKIFVDGADEGTLATEGSGNTTSLEGNWYGDFAAIDTCRIGCQERSNTIDSFFNGNIDEVAVWDSALTASQIANIYKGESNGGSGGTNGTPGNLLSFSPNHWWRMGDGLEANSGTTVYDMALGGVNAAVVNDTSGNTSPVYQADTP